MNRISSIVQNPGNRGTHIDRTVMMYTENRNGEGSTSYMKKTNDTYTVQQEAT